MVKLKPVNENIKLFPSFPLNSIVFVFITLLHCFCLLLLLTKFLTKKNPQNYGNIKITQGELDNDKQSGKRYHQHT